MLIYPLSWTYSQTLFFLSKSFYLSAISEVRTSAYAYQRLCIRNVHAVQSVTQSEWNNHSRSFYFIRKSLIIEYITFFVLFIIHIYRFNSRLLSEIWTVCAAERRRHKNRVSGNVPRANISKRRIQDGDKSLLSLVPRSISGRYRRQGNDGRLQRLWIGIGGNLDILHFSHLHITYTYMNKARYTS